MSGPDRLPQAHVAHAVAGRTQLVVPARRGDTAFFATAVTALRAAAGVAAVAATPRLGSLVVRHAGDFAPVAAAARSAGLFAVSTPPAVPARPRRAGRRLPALALVAGGLAGLGAMQAARGRFAGNAVELLWNGFQASRRLGLPSVSRALVGIGVLQLARGQVLGSASSLLFYALAARDLARDKRDGG